MSKYIVASSQNIAIAPVLQRSALSCKDRRWATDQICVKRPQSLPLCHATAAGNPVAAQLQARLSPSPELPQSFGVLSSHFVPSYHLAQMLTLWTAPRPPHSCMKLHTHSLVCIKDRSSHLPLLTQFLVSSGSQRMPSKPAASAAPGTL